MVVDVIGRFVGIHKKQTKTFDNITTHFAEITLEDTDRESEPRVTLQFCRAKAVGDKFNIANFISQVMEDALNCKVNRRRQCSIVISETENIEFSVNTINYLYYL
ncbi:lipid-A-disaccharide synthase [Striga asiatica]|uniref:Lipid-A-disaccharide synthase n=1 Tax=Striga asiatica TaxID=4170 RepID=A0A5A7Q7W0_STRAF|nr:lipid-A-disaccharide synthase [Striga asiatica]